MMVNKILLSAIFPKLKKSILINHGMAEHQQRYKEFINFLNLNGINVFIYDHRGHGNRITASDPLVYLQRKWLEFSCK